MNETDFIHLVAGCVTVMAIGTALCRALWWSGDATDVEGDLE